MKLSNLTKLPKSNTRTSPPYEEYNGNIIVDDKTRSRLKDLQNEYHLADSNVAAIMGVSLNRYKNLKKHNGLQKFPANSLRLLANHYECTLDYLLGVINQTNMKWLKNDDVDPPIYVAKRVSIPVDFHDKEKLLTDLNIFFHQSENFEILQSIHFLLIQLPSHIRKNLIKSTNGIVTLLKDNMLLTRKDHLNEHMWAFMENNLIIDSPELTTTIINLAEADLSFSKKKFHAALVKYLEIIYYSSTTTKNPASQALDKILILKQRWNKFPEELNDSLFKELNHLKENNFKKCSPDVYTTIYNYLTKYNPKLKDRDTYLNEPFYE